MEDEMCTFLDQPRFRGTPLRSISTLLQTISLMVAWWWLAIRVERMMTTIVLGIVWGMLVLRSYMIFHDCGHGSFFQGSDTAKRFNWLTLHVSAVMCATPTDWNVGHKLHHANVGKTGQDDYDWGETIFHTSSQFVSLPHWKQRLWCIIHHPIPFFTLAPIFTWFVKMRLPFELRPRRKAAYRFRDKIQSTAFVVTRYYYASRLGILPLVLGGDYMAMFIGVLLFHWQHVYEPGYVRPLRKWKLKEAAMQGSSIIVIPKPFKYFTFGIEYHHIHHLRTRIPGYMLREVHESAPTEYFENVPVLGAKELWRALFLQIWDDENQRYVTFDSVIASHIKVE